MERRVHGRGSRLPLQLRRRRVERDDDVDRGGYPDGDITHAYRDTGSVDVRVDARLTGSYRVDGGAWQDIETVADLQDEPAATYEVVEAKNRLQADPAG